MGMHMHTSMHMHTGMHVHMGMHMHMGMHGRIDARKQCAHAHPPELPSSRTSLHAHALST